MRTSFIDYSRLYHQEITRSPLPAVRKGKFVQIWHDDKDELIVAAPRGLATLHAHIVERFLTQHGVAGEYTAKRDVYLLRASGARRGPLRAGRGGSSAAPARLLPWVWPL